MVIQDNQKSEHLEFRDAEDDPRNGSIMHPWLITVF